MATGIPQDRQFESRNSGLQMQQICHSLVTRNFISRDTSQYHHHFDAACQLGLSLMWVPNGRSQNDHELYSFGPGPGMCNAGHATQHSSTGLFLQRSYDASTAKLALRPINSEKTKMFQHPFWVQPCYIMVWLVKMQCTGRHESNGMSGYTHHT